MTTTQDAPHTTPLDGNCTSTLPGNPCTLRAAVQAANFLGNVQTINLQAAGTYVLTVTGQGEQNAATGDLNINGVNLTINNTSGGTVAIDGNNTDRVFWVATLAAAQLTISNVTIQHGAQSGLIQEAIRVESRPTASLTMNTASIRNNAAGGISASGPFFDAIAATVTLTNVTIADNHGSAISGGPTLTITNSTITGNGGGITGASLVMTGTTVSNNDSGVAAGPGNFPVLALASSITNSTITNNRSGGVGYGAAVSGATLSITNTVISANRAQQGAGVSVAGGAVTLTGVTISGNSADNQGGGIFVRSGSFPASSVSATNTTVSGNGVAAFGSQGGGIYNAGAVNLLNVTVANNTAAGQGSGIFDVSSATNPTSFSMKNTLISNNVAVGNALAL